MSAFHGRGGRQTLAKNNPGTRGVNTGRGTAHTVCIMATSAGSTPNPLLESGSATLRPLSYPGRSVHDLTILAHQQCTLKSGSLRWARHAHRSPRSREELIRNFRRLRKALHEHRAEYDEGLEVVMAGRREGASMAARHDGLIIETLLNDIAEETELVSVKHTAAAERSDCPLQSSFRARKRRLRLRIADMTEAIAELFNEGGDLLFMFVLWRDALWLFYISVVLLTANMLGRLWVICGHHGHVAKGKRGKFMKGAGICLVEPNTGLRWMKKALNDKAEGGLIFVAGRGYVSAEKDAIAVDAENSLLAGKAEIQTIALMAGTEDLPQLIIQLLFLLLYDGGDLVAFWLAAMGTVVHLLQRGAEAAITNQSLEQLKSVSHGRDRVFSPDATNLDVVNFVQEFGSTVRIINVTGCTQLTDDCLSAVAENCPYLTQFMARGCEQITDDGLVTLAEGCRHIEFCHFRGCQLTDVSASKIAECWREMDVASFSETKITDDGLGQLATLSQWTILGLDSTLISDVGVAKVCDNCHQLRTLNLSNTKLTDAALERVAEGCPNLTCLYVAKTQVTDEGVMRVAENCHHLTWIYVEDTNVTDECIHTLSSNFPNLTVSKNSKH
eukprot:COSAG01_NODE_5041_length_4529_cov_3.719413_2_plen_614_part_00